MAACNGQSGMDQDGSRPSVLCGQTSVVGDATPPETTLYFIIGALQIDVANGDNWPAMISDNPDMPHTGFNLDGLYSGPEDPDACNHDDFFSILDEDQNHYPYCRMDGCGGVDNQLPALAGFLPVVLPDYDPISDLASSIQQARRLYLIQLDGVDNLCFDSDVTLTLLLVYDADGDCGNNFTGSGSFVARAESFVNGDPSRPRWQTHAAINAGRVMTDAFPGIMPVPLVRTFVDAETHDTQIRFDIVDNGSGSRGSWGAWVDPAPLIAIAGALAPDAAHWIPGFVGSLVDIRRDGICFDATGPTPRYGGVSLGYGFTVAPARLTGVAAGAPAGSCSTASSDAGGGD
jgi:hypothetical protein